MTRCGSDDFLTREARPDPIMGFYDFCVGVAQVALFPLLGAFVYAILLDYEKRNSCRFPFLLHTDSDSSDDTVPGYIAEAESAFTPYAASGGYLKTGSFKRLAGSRKKRLPPLLASDTCAICMDAFGDMPNAQLCEVNRCGHVFCKTCIYPWLRRSDACPLCKQWIC